jgi:Tfp pilus tip-associated adhesin PilY1
MLSDPIVFYGKVYFTTFTPNLNDPCSGGGISRVFGLDYQTGGAGLRADATINANETAGNRTLVPYHVYATQGVASSPSLSVNPSEQSSLFIGFSEAPVLELKIDSPQKMKTLKSWREIF